MDQLDNEPLYRLIVKHGGKRPEPGKSEDELRQLLRDAYEAELEAEQPLAGFDQREREAWKAAGIPHPQEVKRSKRPKTTNYTVNY